MSPKVIMYFYSMETCIFMQTPTSSTLMLSDSFTKSYSYLLGISLGIS